MDRKDLQQVMSESLAVEIEDAKRTGNLGYMARALVQATLPHKAISDNEFHRENGLFSLSILAPKKVGLPFGSIPRLLLSWMTTEAVATRSPSLELGPTLSAFLEELGLNPTGGKRGDITRLRRQAESLFCSSISCNYSDEASAAGAGFRITKDYALWWTPKAPDQLPLWKSTVTLSMDFYNEIIDRPVPVDMLALKALKRSPMALDIYFWLTYRMSYLSRDTVIPWPLLQGQFGAGYPQTTRGLYDFRLNFLKQLKKVHSIYSKARVGEVDNGLLLKPSPPHVAKRAAPTLEGVRRKAGAPSGSALLAPKLPSAEVLLQTETYAKAKRAAPGMDIYYLEQEWFEWIAKSGKQPENPDGAFIGFCKKKAKEHGQL